MWLPTDAGEPYKTSSQQHRPIQPAEEGQIFTEVTLAGEESWDSKLMRLKLPKMKEQRTYLTHFGLLAKLAPHAEDYITHN